MVKCETSGICVLELAESLDEIVNKMESKKNPDLSKYEIEEINDHIEDYKNQAFKLKLNPCKYCPKIPQKT